MSQDEKLREILEKVYSCDVRSDKLDKDVIIDQAILAIKKAGYVNGRVIPCGHLVFKATNNKITELFIDNEQWIKKNEIKVDGKKIKSICLEELCHPDSFDDLKIDPLDINKRQALKAIAHIIAYAISRQIGGLVK